jgi:hypothetical protein
MVCCRWTHKKLFFFVDYQGFRDLTISTLNDYLPTAAERRRFQRDTDSRTCLRTESHLSSSTPQHVQCSGHTQRRSDRSDSSSAITARRM